MRLIAAAVIALLSTAVQAVEVYKWVDKDGVVHYGDRPRPGAEMLEVREPPPGDTALAEAAKAQEAREAECQRLTGQLDSYRKATGLRETDNLGRTREFTEAERQQFLENFEKKVAGACAPAEPAPAP